MILPALVLHLLVYKSCRVGSVVPIVRSLYTNRYGVIFPLQFNSRAILFCDLPFEKVDAVFVISPFIYYEMEQPLIV